MALIKAAKKGSLEDVDKIVSNDPNLIENEKDKTGSNALIYACYYGHYVVAKYLLDHGANMEIKNTSGSTPLMTASKNNHCAIMELLLERGANIDGRSKWGNTALMTAARNGNIQAVQFLLERGANVWAKCEKGLTAGEVAWREEIKEIIKSYEDGHPITARKSGRFAMGNYSQMMSYGQAGESTPAVSSNKAMQQSTLSGSKQTKNLNLKSPAKKPVTKPIVNSTSSVSSVSSVNSRTSISSRNSISSSTYMTPRKTASISSVNTNTTVPIHRSTPQRGTTPNTKTPQTPSNAKVGIQSPSWEILFQSIRTFEQWHQYHIIHLQYQEAMTHDQYYVAKTLLDQLHKVQASIAATKKEQTIPTDASLVSFDDLDSEIDKYSISSNVSQRNSLKPDALKIKTNSIMSPTSPSLPTSPSSILLTPTTFRGINEYLQTIFNFQKDLLAEKSKLKELCKQQVSLFPVYEQCHVYLHVMNVYAAQVMSLQQSLLQQFSHDEKKGDRSSSVANNVELTPVWEQCFIHVQSILQKHHSILTSLLYQKAVDSNDTSTASTYYENLVSEHTQRQTGNVQPVPNVQHVFQHVSQYYHHLLSLRKELLVFQQLLQQIVKFHIKYFQHWKLCQELILALNQIITEIKGTEESCEGTEGIFGDSILGSPGGESRLEDGFTGKWISGGQWISLWRNDVNEVAAYDQSVKSDDDNEDQFVTY